ncbi:MAG: hypothetical protein JNK31_06525, partial [Candidatus Competibacter sp.]|nr:hypothetical protein [Candidatus Competibacter sp.]
DNDLDDDEIAALVEEQIQDKLGVDPRQFRKVLRDLCGKILVDDERHASLAARDQSDAIEIMELVNRDVPMSLEAASRVVDLIYDSDPDLIFEMMLDEERVDAALARIDDPQLRLWTVSMLAKLIQVDDEAHENERGLLHYILNRWGILRDALNGELTRG